MTQFIILITQNILQLYMTTFKEIDINEYKKLLDYMQHTYAKTFKNIELLHNFEENVNDKNIDSVI